MRRDKDRGGAFVSKMDVPIGLNILRSGLLIVVSALSIEILFIGETEIIFAHRKALGDICQTISIKEVLHFWAGTGRLYEGGYIN